MSMTGEAIKGLFGGIGKELASRGIDTAKAPIKKIWQGYQWLKGEEAYTEKIKNRYGTTRILGKTEPIPLDDIFTHLNILDRPTSQRYFADITELQNMLEQREVQYEAKYRPALEVVREKQKLLLLGKPGAGKTTFLRYIALEAINNRRQLPYIPIFVSLNEFSDSNKTLMEFIAHQFDVCNFPQEGIEQFLDNMLSDGKAIILLDGLDEVNEDGEKRRSVIQQIKDLTDKYDKNRYIMTCRIAANEYIFEAFTECEIADFNENQINTYVERYFSHDLTKLNLFRDDFQKDSSKGLRELAKTPLLLGMICLAFEDNMSLPERRVDIYDNAFDALLRRWDTSRNIRRDEMYKNLSVNRKKQMFNKIATEFFQEGDKVFYKEQLSDKIIKFLKSLPDYQVSNDIEGDMVIKAIEAQHGIFIEQAQKIYSFSHLTLQEYFTAQHIKENPDAIMRMIQKHSLNPQWREVFLMTFSLLPEADRYLEQFLKYIVEFISRDETISNFFRWLTKQADTLVVKIVSKDIAIVRKRLALFEYDLSVKGESVEFWKDLESLENNNKNLKYSQTDSLYLAYYCLQQKPVSTNILQAFIRHALDFAKYENPKHQLYRDLRGLPDIRMQTLRKKYNQELQKISYKHFNILCDWQFTEAQTSELSKILKMSFLLHECIRVASVEDRDIFYKQLYTLPNYAVELSN